MYLILLFRDRVRQNKLLFSYERMDFLISSLIFVDDVVTVLPKMRAWWKKGPLLKTTKYYVMCKEKQLSHTRWYQHADHFFLLALILLLANLRFHIPFISMSICILFLQTNLVYIPFHSFSVFCFCLYNTFCRRMGLPFANIVILCFILFNVWTRMEAPKCDGCVWECVRVDFLCLPYIYENDVILGVKIL